MKKIAFSAVVLIGATLSSQAQNISPDELARRATERRAVDAVIWGHAGGQLRPDAPGDADQDTRQGEPGHLLGPPARLEEPDADAQS
jgi:hypothetical protein